MNGMLRIIYSINEKITNRKDYNEELNVVLRMIKDAYDADIKYYIKTYPVDAIMGAGDGKYSDDLKAVGSLDIVFSDLAGAYQFIRENYPSSKTIWIGNHVVFNNFDNSLIRVNNYPVDLDVGAKVHEYSLYVKLVEPKGQYFVEIEKDDIGKIFYSSVNGEFKVTSKNGSTILHMKLQ